MMLLSVLLALMMYPLTGCETLPKQSVLLQQQGKEFRMSVTELRILIQQKAYRFSAVIEQAADEIMAKSSDPIIRRNALLWKMNAIPAAYTAVFQSEPVVALLDTWALTVQMVHYFEDGPGVEDFGQYHTVALEASKHLEEEIVDLVLAVSPTGDIKEVEIREEVYSWAREHPIQSPLFSRESVLAEFSEAMSESSRAIGVVGKLTVGMDDIVTRLSLYNEYLPRQARWQAELLLAESNAKDGVKVNVDGVAELIESLDRVMPIIEQAPDLVARERTAAFKGIREERIATLNSIGVQRVATLNWLTKERIAVIDALQKERGVALAALREERAASFNDIEAISNRIVSNSLAETKGLIDHFFWRTAQLLVVLVIACFIVGFIIVRIAKK
jgi:hypothetical protein